MAQDPNTERPRPVEPKVGAYSTRERRGGAGTIISILVALAVILLILWAFTDII
jgi:hypothetical protein